MISDTDRDYLLRAIDLASRGGRATAPNPRVGAVIVDGGEIIAESWHERAGGPHAEARALAAAGGRARGATAYVSLEPCAHHGKTPPCADALVRAGIVRVVVGLIDPDERVRGRGIERLEQGGVVVDRASGALQERASEAVEDYLVHRRESRAFVVHKAAVTLDGRIADREGRSQWISGPAAREHGRRLRDRYGAILVGIGTVKADDPRLLAPTGAGGGVFYRCVVDPGLDLPLEARILDPESRDQPVVVFARNDSDPTRRVRLEAAGAEVVGLPPGDEGLSPRAIAQDLGRRGVLGVIVEGGGRTAGRFFRAGLVDKLAWYLAPRLLGDPRAVPVLRSGACSLQAAWGGRIAETRRLGEDLFLTIYPQAARDSCSPDS